MGVDVRQAWASVLVLCAFASACEPPPRMTRVPTQAQWNDGLARLEHLRASFPKQPYTQPISVEFFEPRSRQRFSGRGAVGVDPGHAMRMILVGPAGEPALDVWVTRDAWRMQVPAIKLLRRGGTESPPSLPIGFFRSWFVDPLAGRLLSLGLGDELVVRDPSGGTLHITHEDSTTHVTRRHGTQTESFAYAARDAGGRATYRDETTRLEVAVSLDALQANAPDPEAFVDPDRPAGSMP